MLLVEVFTRSNPLDFVVVMAISLGTWTCQSWSRCLGNRWASDRHDYDNDDGDDWFPHQQLETMQRRYGKNAASMLFAS